MEQADFLEKNWPAASIDNGQQLLLLKSIKLAD